MKQKTTSKWQLESSLFRYNPNRILV